MTARGTGGHVTEFDIAGYLDRGLSQADRDRVENHLSECTECRHSVAATQHLLSRAKRPRRLLGIATIVAVAATALVVVQLQRPLAEREPLRAASTDGSAIVAYSPLGEVAPESIRFMWGRLPEAISYRLTVSSPDGAVVYSNSGVDTTVVLPVNVRLVPSAKYTWVADAIMKDGSTRSTGLRDFELVR